MLEVKEALLRDEEEIHTKRVFNQFSVEPKGREKLYLRSTGGFVVNVS